jgi:hypothetical protein
LYNPNIFSQNWTATCDSRVALSQRNSNVVIYHEGKTPGSILSGLVYAHGCALLVCIHVYDAKKILVDALGTLRTTGTQGLFGLLPWPAQPIYWSLTSSRSSVWIDTKDSQLSQFFGHPAQFTRPRIDEVLAAKSFANFLASQFWQGWLGRDPNSPSFFVSPKCGKRVGLTGIPNSSPRGLNLK